MDVSRREILINHTENFQTLGALNNEMAGAGWLSNKINGEGIPTLFSLTPYVSVLSNWKHSKNQWVFYQLLYIKFH